MDSKFKSDVAFGRALRHLRKLSGFTQEQLGEGADKDRTYISLLERGYRSPSLNTMLELCEAMHITFPVMAQQIISELDANDD